MSLSTIPAPVTRTTKETSLLHDELVAHSTYSYEMGGLLRVPFELSADVCDVAPYRV